MLNSVQTTFLSLRDLKLENLLLSASGYLKLVDFGLCKEGMGPRNTTSTFCGTPEFLAPEMITSTSYTRAVDWWSLGVLIYEMLIGKVRPTLVLFLLIFKEGSSTTYFTFFKCPFLGSTEDEIYTHIVREEPRVPIRVGTKATEIIHRFLEKDPSRRLGATSGGVAEIKSQSFFSDINFEDILQRRMRPPFAPRIVSLLPANSLNV